MQDNLTDNELMKKLQDGEVKALEVLYDRYYRYVFAMIIRDFDNEIAEDISQEVFLYVLTKCDRYKLENNFLGWLIYVVRREKYNYCLKQQKNKLRMENFHAKRDKPQAFPSVDELILKEEFRDILHKAFGLLPVHMLDNVIDNLRYSCGVSEIARKTELPRHVVRHRIEICVRKLKEYIAGYFNDEEQ